ncbi:MAG: hypothetical protein A2544_01185 [Candidatus Zambryskibacteria bacterium RIFOXYD2_FULL_43_10]|uniref:Antitoxin SocA-like Panacea domain-containing protein n=1 Tax=Candidatus Zambryskibacteria bacterium RIFOXYD2_FULL_43_10 TaxID=1802782 RepID=A0A1G2V994_9BACT|nr:MAG: hypothetical protein A2544_01185 [Candidatus Zambryskibacteria bacterium RIFOXYD2_FULL_43_10]
MEIMKDRAKWILMALFVAGEEGLSPAQLQKAIFLLQKAFPNLETLSYNFQPYNYGPFDVGVYHDVEMLADNALVELRQRGGHNWSSYHISETGKKTSELLKNSLDSDAVLHLTKLVKLIQSVSFQTLIGSIYKKYPEYKKNSIFKDR